MRTILEALSRWQPPAGKVTSASVAVADGTLDHTATVVVERMLDRPATLTLRLPYRDAMTLPAAEIALRLTVAAQAACAAPRDERPAGAIPPTDDGPSPPHRQPEPRPKAKAG